jgi:hypothetical protein
MQARKIAPEDCDESPPNLSERFREKGLILFMSRSLDKKGARSLTVRENAACSSGNPN